MSQQQYAIAQLNQMSQAEFTAALGEIWEDTPKIAERAWNSRPFEHLDDLYRSMVTVVESMSDRERLELIQAHPDLAGKAKMAEASVREQAGAGLNRLSEIEYRHFQNLNQAYKDKFGFPFIIAVKNHTKESILAAFAARLQNNHQQERQQALEEIAKIARLRLNTKIDTSSVT